MNNGSEQYKPLDKRFQTGPPCNFHSLDCFSIPLDSRSIAKLLL